MQALFWDRLEEIAGISFPFLPRAARDRFVARAARARARALGLPSIAAYERRLLRASGTQPEWRALLNELRVTNTWFFRERKQLERLAGLLAGKIRGKKREITILCAGCSTGEEAFSLAVLLERKLKGRGDFRIVAADINTDALAVARLALYPRRRLRYVPAALRASLADGAEVRKPAQQWIEIRASLRQRISFTRSNVLTHRRAGPTPPYDAIVCRNLLCYFSAAAKEGALRNLHANAAPSALLAATHVGGTRKSRVLWKRVERGIYARTLTEVSARRKR